MKKSKLFSLIALVLAMLMVFAACAPAANNEADPTEGKSDAQVQTPADKEDAGEDDLDLDEGYDEDALELDMDDDSDDESAFEDEDEDAFDVDAFFNEMNPTINDAGFGNGFVPDEDNM